jgi:hypothetical protein
MILDQGIATLPLAIVLIGDDSWLSRAFVHGLCFLVVGLPQGNNVYRI